MGCSSSVPDLKHSTQATSNQSTSSTQNAPSSSSIPKLTESEKTEQARRATLREDQIKLVFLAKQNGRQNIVTHSFDEESRRNFIAKVIPKNPKQESLISQI